MQKKNHSDLCNGGINTALADIKSDLFVMGL